MAYPQTIQIFLPDGNPRGIKIAEITNRTIKAILFPRNQFEAILQRPELANVGFYFLFGVADNGHEMAYIGEAEDCAERLKQHQRNKDFWNYAVVIISQTHAFTKTHVKYLEYVAIKKASETGRYDLDNSAIPNRPHITESMEADAEDCFEIAKVLLSTLGFPLFDSVAREVVASTPVDVYKGLKGITSTDPYYAAFGFLGVDNVASAIDSAYVSPITGTYIDWEQLVDWDPEVIFIDRSGWPLVNEDFKNREKLNQLLAAYRNQQVYALWPYNNNHTNFEVMLINAWYAGKILFPDQFQDISLRDKADEILVEFVGQPIGQELRTKWGDYENLLTENHER